MSRNGVGRDRHQVVIIGGGFGGMEATRRLKRANDEITVVDRPNHPEISVIGDAAKLAGADGKPLPGLATVALQQARHVAKAIRDGEPGASRPFRYFDKGALAVVGRGRAVCEVRGHRLYGLPAFVMYIAVHLFYLGGVGGRRLTAGIDAISSLFGSRHSRVIESELQGMGRPVSQPAPPRRPCADGDADTARLGVA